MGTCSHVWIDPLDVPIARRPIAPLVGDGRRMMRPGRTYVCAHCPATVTTPITATDPRAGTCNACQQPVAEHFDRHNHKLSCEELAQRRSIYA